MTNQTNKIIEICRRIDRLEKHRDWCESETGLGDCDCGYKDELIKALGIRMGLAAKREIQENRAENNESS